MVDPYILPTMRTDSMTPARLFPRLLQCLIICGVGLLVYANSFTVPFQFDDESFIVNNADIRELSDIKAIWEATPIPTRFLSFFSFALNYHLNGLDPTGYHVFNILIHLTAALCVFWLVRLLIQVTKGKGETAPGDNLVPFFCALLFVTHPVQTQAVTYISQRMASMATLFYVSSLCFFLQSFLSRRFLRKVVCGAAAGFFAVAGMLTKEIAVTLPVMAATVYFSFIWKRKRDGLLPAGIVLAGLGLLALVPYLYEFKILNLLTTHVPSQSHDGDIITLGTYILTQFRVFMRFLQLLIFPVGLNLDYDFPLSRSLFEPRTFLAILGTIAFLTGTIFAAKRDRLAALGMFWMALTFSVNFIPRANVIFEHKLYLISVGFVIALSSAVVRLGGKRRARVILTVIVLCFGLLTYLRNNVWQSEETLWRDVLAKSPDKARPHVNMGQVYYKKGNLQEALNHFKEAIRLNPLGKDAYLNRGNMFYDLNDFVKAITAYSAAIEIDPQFVAAYINRGNAYARIGDNDSALRDYERALKEKSGYGLGYLSRGNLFAKRGDYSRAVEDYTKAIRAHVHLPEVYRNRANAYRFLGEYQKAIEDFNRALKINSADPLTYYHRSQTHRQNGDIRKALDDALMAKRLGYPVPASFLRSLQKGR